MLDVSKAAGWIRKQLAGDFKVKLIVFLGLVGMLLILLGQLRESSPDRGESGAPQNTISAEYTLEQYAASLEDRLSAIIANIDGVGRVEVMITLEQDEEYIYAQEEKSTVDRSSSGALEASGTVDYKADTQSTYVFVDSGYGEKQPLVRTRVPPKVQGVVIVCEGADNIRVEQDLINVVTTALHIPTTRVCVVKIN